MEWIRQRLETQKIRLSFDPDNFHPLCTNWTISFLLLITGVEMVSLCVLDAHLIIRKLGIQTLKKCFPLHARFISLHPFKPLFQELNALFLLLPSFIVILEHLSFLGVILQDIWLIGNVILVIHSSQKVHFFILRS